MRELIHRNERDNGTIVSNQEVLGFEMIGHDEDRFG